jgi:NTE family protein
VVLVPASESAPSPFSSGTAAEIAAFSARTFAVFADDASLVAFGPNLLDPRCRRPSALAGREQGRRLAAALTEFLK